MGKNIILSYYLGIISHNFLINKLVKYRIGKWTVRWIRKLTDLLGSKGCYQ